MPAFSIDNWAIYAKNVKSPRKGPPSSLNLLKKLKVTPETRKLMEEEIAAIGMQYHHFENTSKAQGIAK
jgi:hypothetical protein